MGTRVEDASISPIETKHDGSPFVARRNDLVQRVMTIRFRIYWESGLGRFGDGRGNDGFWCSHDSHGNEEHGIYANRFICLWLTGTRWKEGSRSLGSFTFVRFLQ
jgi:hypothetical protein